MFKIRMFILCIKKLLNIIEKKNKEIWTQIMQGNKFIYKNSYLKKKKEDYYLLL